MSEESRELSIQEQHPLMRVNQATGEVAVVDAQPYRGIAVARFTLEQEHILSEPIPEADLDILPTGEVYASQIRYRRILNLAFGPGGWALMPRGPLIIRDNILYREYALFCEGRFVAESVGEQEYIPNNPRMTYAAAAEAVKSNALVRCCKDLLIASECWDRHFTEEFKDKYCEKYLDKRKNKYFWRRKESTVSPDEEDGGEGARLPTGAGGQGGRRARAGGTGGAPPSVPAALGPDDPSTAEQRAAFWRACKRQLGDIPASNWLMAQLQEFGLSESKELKCGQLNKLYERLQALAAAGRLTPEPGTDDSVSSAEEPDIEY